MPVSVILPLYNGRRYLAEAVQSVSRQTRPPDELIVVDDGSTDGGVELLEGIPAPFPVKIVVQENAGQSAARNEGVRVAGGELLAIRDQDDAWHPEHLAVLCAAFRDPFVGWSYSDFDEIDGSGRTVTLSFLNEHGVSHPKRSLGACLGGDLMVIPSASVIRRTAFDAWGGFDEALQGYEDDDLYVRAFRSGWRLVYCRLALTRFRIHDTSSSANGLFVESRVRFSKKLEAAVADDRRLNRYYFRDLVAPRFFATSLDDYVHAVSDRNWHNAETALITLKYFARRRRDYKAIRWKLALVSNPRLFRHLMQIHDSLPSRLRLNRNPVLKLR
ncbi:MAG: glycosyltransferase family 2 protein [Acidimicrobiales bacterium]